jgi:hypothetical protein
MSDPLAEANQALTTLLATAITDVPAFSEPPEKALPPFIVVGPADPWLDFEGAPFGYCRVHQYATLITERGTNDVRAAALRTGAVAIAQVVDAADDFAVTQIEQPGVVSINGQECLAVSVTTVTEVAF